MRRTGIDDDDTDQRAGMLGCVLIAIAIVSSWLLVGFVGWLLFGLVAWLIDRVRGG